MSKDQISNLIEAIQKKLDKGDMTGALKEKEKLDDLTAKLGLALAAKTYEFMQKECDNVNTIWPAVIALLKHFILLLRGSEVGGVLKAQVEQLASEIVNMVTTKEIKLEHQTRH
jgi:hypothetical protein